jgi:2-polyprenyl-3-methyl-5-hydroxy-6-metoxy-1,4-benzoquinol methylase
LDYKSFYQDSWAQQRAREGNATVQARSRFLVDRYSVAEEFVAASHRGGGSFIDVGCGRGEMIRRLAGRFDRLVGLDVAESELALLRSSLSPDARAKTELREADLTREWPIGDGPFDVVTCLAVLEHLPDPFDTARKLAGAVKPGGFLVVEVPNIAYLKYRLSLLRGVFPKTSGDPQGWDGGHLAYFTDASVTQLFARYGLAKLRVAGTGRFGRVRSLWPSLLTADIVVLFKKSA